MPQRPIYIDIINDTRESPTGIYCSFSASEASTVIKGERSEPIDNFSDNLFIIFDHFWKFGREKLSKIIKNRHKNRQKY